jgi:hypothetical protein
MSESEQGRPQAEGDDVAIAIGDVFAAAAAGDAAALTAALASSGPDAASHQDRATGRSALFSAAEADSVECVALLLEAGAPWNAALLEAGVRAELVLGALSEAAAAAAAASSSPLPASLPAAEGIPYLKQRATFHASASNGDATLSDEQGRAVMMEWEGGIMKATAHAVAKGARRNEDGSGGGVGKRCFFSSGEEVEGRDFSLFG